MTHRHRRDPSLDSAPRAMSGMGGCPGCYNAFSRIIEYCRCGARREICSGMGTASLTTHIAHGYSRWEEEEERLGRRC